MCSATMSWQTMGFTLVRFTVSHPLNLERSAEVELLAETGALNSFVPSEILESLGIPRQFRRAFQLANGQIIERDVGLAFFRWDTHMSGAAVVFAEPGDMPLLGVTALGAMGLALDPNTRKLIPTPSLLV